MVVRQMASSGAVNESQTVGFVTADRSILLLLGNQALQTFGAYSSDSDSSALQIVCHCMITQTNTFYWELIVLFIDSTGLFHNSISTMSKVLPYVDPSSEKLKYVNRQIRMNVVVRCLCRHIIFTLQYRELVVVCHVPIRVLRRSVQKADAFSANGRAGAGSTVGQRMRLGTDDKYLNFNT